MSQHEVTTVAYAGWGGLKNGELLKMAEEAGFEVFVTGDRALEFQQNITGRRIAIVLAVRAELADHQTSCWKDCRRDRWRGCRSVSAGGLWRFCKTAKAERTVTTL